MRVRELHPWDLDIAAAVALQKQLAGRVDDRTPLGPCELVAAADVSHGWRSNTFFAGVVVLRTSDLALVEQQGVVREATFGYHSGLLSFREAPALLEAFRQVKSEPDAVIIDGHGRAHPRRFGVACHLGLWLDRPTVGFAKTRLTGTFVEPGPEPGDRSPLMAGGEVIGEAVRTKRRTKPVFVSVGHHVMLADAVRLVLQCCRGYRIPEPVRQAHQYVNALRRAANC